MNQMLHPFEFVVPANIVWELMSNISFIKPRRNNPAAKQDSAHCTMVNVLFHTKWGEMHPTNTHYGNQ